MKRRDIFRMGGAAMAGLANSMIPSSRGQGAGTKKKVTVIGAGIAALSCAYELVKRGRCNRA